MHQIAAEIIRMAAGKKLRVCTVESVSGGQIAAALTSVPSSSSVFFAGGIFYDTGAKIIFLDIPDSFFEKHGVYSEKCAAEMAKAWRKKCDADFCVSTTGQAEGENAGRVFFGIAGKKSVETFEKIFSGNRQDVQGKAREFALEILRKAVISF